MPELAAGSGITLARDPLTDILTVSASAAAATIYLVDHGIVADGVTVNSAAAVEALIAAIASSRGGEIVFPYGTSLWDRTINIHRPMVLRGYGGGDLGGGDGHSGTNLQFPAGQTGLRIWHTTSPGAQGTEICNLRITQASLLATTGTASFNTASPTTITVSAGAANFANNQVVLLEGGGPSITLPDRTFTLANGATSGTWVYADGQYRGNAIGYVGQVIDIAGAGLPSGTTITAWGVGTFTVSNAATAAGAAGGGVSATIKCPLVGEISAGGGTGTLTIASQNIAGQNVTSGVLRHAAPGIHITTGNVKVRNVQVINCQVGIYVHGNTAGGEVADNNSFYDCTLNNDFAGVILEGADAQVNSFYSINFAGPRVGVLDMSFIENDYLSCHWAFNCGLMGTAAMRVFGGYMENGTSYISGNGSSFMLGTQSFVPGSGFNGFSTGAAQLTFGNFEALQARLDAAHLGNGNTGYMVRIQPGPTNVPNFVRVGSGLEIIYDGTGILGSILTVGTGANDKRLVWQGLQVELWNASGGVARTAAGKFDLYSGITYSINGTQVVGPRQTGTPAAATDLATALTLLNDIRTKLIAHGLVS